MCALGPKLTWLGLKRVNECNGDFATVICFLAYPDPTERKIPSSRLLQEMATNYYVRFGVWVWLICGVLLFGEGNHSSAMQNDSPSFNSNNSQQGSPNLGDKDGHIEILSDTKGADVHPYLDGVLPKIKANWYSHMPQSVYPPIRKKGNVLIGFRVMKSGKITNVKYEKTSGDVALDRAAYAGIIDSSPLPPLPNGFACQFVELRFRFYYNADKGEIAEKPSATLPCVTTTIRPTGGDVEGDHTH
jgi:TonB family protein